MKEKVVLAYSGGLDTTALIPWLKETFDYDVVCCCVNCGQGNELDGLEERAKLSGAAKLYIEDIVDDFCDNYIMPCVQAGAVYEHKYLLGTSMARPAIAKKLVEIARKEGCLLYTSLGGAVCCALQIPTRWFLFPLLPVIMLIYHKTLKISVWKSVSIFLAVFAVFTCVKSLSRAVNALMTADPVSYTHLCLCNVFLYNLRKYIFCQNRYVCRKSG